MAAYKHTISEHRSVWAPEVKNRRQAALYINKRIEDHAIAADAEKILDLGCGIGSTMTDLAKAREARYSGLTASRNQKQTGDELILKQGLQESIRIFEGNFSNPRVFRLFPDQDLIYAVESTAALRAETDIGGLIAENLVSGGRMILCDYMLSKAEENLSAHEQKLLESLKELLHLPGIRSAQEWIGVFEDAGLETIAAEDFSSWLKVPLFSSLPCTVLLPVAGKIEWPWIKRAAGITALHTLLRRGSMQYRFLVFQKNQGKP
ncbi:class I SAM-dependent methyltransferase [Marispirochaeta sp.]|uniref:class I SAM-dependent methyltransferase n=1 Tax=Marispirochaeta sp. TaxID=2038653 RepID=UPI0029C91546|nr:class I SAM-dependent methyltransferase [Marispirochaeta sp.]